ITSSASASSAIGRGCRRAADVRPSLLRYLRGERMPTAYSCGWHAGARCLFGHRIIDSRSFFDHAGGRNSCEVFLPARRRDNMIDPAEAIETYRAASAIAAFDAIQVAFAALVKKGILSKVEAEQILRQAIETIKTGGAGDQAAELLTIALEKISKFEPAPRRLCNDDNSDLPRPPYCRHVRGIAA